MFIDLITKEGREFHNLIDDGKKENLQESAGTDPEINQGGWLAWFFIYVVIVSITIVANLKI